nr:LamG-like jellyroll fold domain-containing protein [uncultured Psychroserpens sp.]
MSAPIPDAASLSDITAECQVASLTAPTATDNCGGTVTVTHDATLPISGEGSTTVVTWTYDDGNGNTSTQTQNVIIDDVSAPIPDAASLSDITAECQVASLTAPTATDNCGGTVTVTHDATLPISGEGSTTVVTWTYDDGNGNTSTQTQNVIIDDVSAPIPDAANLSDITAECQVTSLTAPTATDNCGGTVTVTHDATLPISGEGSTTVVTWTYDDGNGNTSTQTQNVIIDDVSAPIPDAANLSDITAECQVASLTAPTATDNCGGTVTVTHDATLPISGEGSTTVVTWTYDDGNGNTSTQTQNVIIDDVSAPIPDAASLSDITAECQVASLTAPTATDNCGGTVTVTHDATLPISGEGSTTVVTWTYDDGNGNTSTQTQNVIIDDVSAPIPDAASLSDITAECQVASLTAPTATDNCGGTVTVTHDATLPISGEGSTTVVTWTYDDGNGNTSTQTQNVIIDDVSAPIPDAANLSDITAECQVASLTAPTATDNCGGTVTVTHDATLPISGEGSTTVVTWTYDDGNGNTSTQTQNVIIDDVSAPIPDAASLSDITAECQVASLTAPTATDNCGGTVTVTHDATLPISGEGSTTVVTWTYDDGNGNTSTQTQNVIIDDVSAPIPDAASLSDITAECQVASLTAPTATDNCGGTVTVTHDATLPISGEGSTTVVTWTYDDGNGNTSTQTQNVIIDDVSAPIPDAASLSDITAECQVASLTAPTATDNCGGTVTVTHDATLPISGEGSTTVVTWTYDDGNGNTSTQTQNVIIDDVSAPIPDVASLSDITAECEVTSLTAPTATDNCGGTVTVTNNASLPISGEGTTTTVTWTYDDGNGNTSTQTQDVIIDDVTNPIAVCQDLTVQLDGSGNANINAVDIDNGSSDNCGIQSISVNPSSFTCADVGPNTVTLTVTDINGNAATCTSTVTVEDNIDPIANNSVCGSIGPLIIDAVSGEVTVTPAQISAAYTGSDACGIDTLVLAQTTFDCDDIGSNNVILTVTDVNGNTNTCSINVVIEAPTIASGVVEGYIDVVNPEPADDLIEVTFCPYDLTTDPPTPAVQGAIFDLTIDPSLVPNILRWEIATYNATTAFWDWVDDGINAGNPTQHSIANVTETTLVRAVIQSGNCIAYSAVAMLQIIPPDEPPTIVGVTSNNGCFPPEYTIEAESFFEYNEQFGDTGLFNSAQPDGWIVDGVPNDIPASGNNTSQGTWKEVAETKELAGIRHYPQEGSKFAAVYGAVDSVLETPVFSTIGMDAADAKFEFYQAYYLCAGASLAIELSLDGGTTYTELLFSDNGQSDTGMTIVRPSGNPNNCNSYDPEQDGYEFISIDLAPYLNEGTLRVRFSFFGVAGGQCSDTFVDQSGTQPCGSITRNVRSSWAIDGVRVPYAPIDEVLEWTDENGNVVASGSTVTVIPVTPGTQIYGVTSLVNGCRLNTDDGTEFVTIDASLAFAGIDFQPSAAECGQSTIDLRAYDNTISANENLAFWNNVMPDQPGNPGTPLFTAPPVDDNGTPGNTADDTYPTNYPGTGMTGTWSYSIVSQSCSTFVPTFSGNGDPRASFTAPPGVYDLTWTLQNNCFDTVRITINNCSDINFDGADDFVTLKDNYALNSAFTIENWVKPITTTGNHTIFSKKNASDNSRGYALYIDNGIVKYSWYSSGGNGTIASQYAIDTSRWYHIAVTFDGSTYTLYIDGIDVGTVTGSVNAPQATTVDVEALIGALDNDNGSNNNVSNLYHGWIDELRIWNTALTEAQVRQMMNQEIEDNTAVRGTVVPLDISGLAWTALNGYYRMDVNCGYLTAYKGVRGRLRNINTSQQETAPLPYTSRVDGQDWATDNTWTNFTVWDAPNSIGVDGATPIDWNIVQTSHDINSGNKDIIVLGLISDTPNKVLAITDPSTAQDETNDGQSLRVTHYLKLDGDIDLFGESQLLQDDGSVLDVTSAGKLERDQQGTSNLYNYNYWSSPVGPTNITSNNNPFSVNGILRDGSISSSPIGLQWTNNHNANGSTTPITLSRYWLFAYENYPEDTYAAWRGLDEADAIASGLSFTMKGSGVGDPIADVQNYVFIGKPNNGTIVTPVTVGNQALVGNPYPSAIDADQFIRDNLPGASGNPGSTQSTDGTLYFWEHYTSNFTHILEDYEGGYATFNLSGGNPAVSPPLVSGNGTPTKLPGQYIPVSQGFFVTASGTGGNIQFKNSQRVFVRETLASSQFIRTSNPNYTVQQDPNPEIQRLRLDFTTENGAVRPLLLAFTPNNEATDGFDYGYDAENADAEFPNDMFWRIGDGNYTTQGVGNFDVNKQYPLALFVDGTETMSISLRALENFDDSIHVYIHDALMGTYYEINSEVFEIALDAETYLDRFYVTFSTEDALSIPEDAFSQAIINYLMSSQEIYVKIPNISEVRSLQLFNLLGQEIQTWDHMEDFELDGTIRIPVAYISEGTYIIKVHTHNTIHSAKVIVKE